MSCEAFKILLPLIFASFSATSIEVQAATKLPKSCLPYYQKYCQSFKKALTCMLNLGEFVESKQCKATLKRIKAKRDQIQAKVSKNNASSSRHNRPEMTANQKILLKSVLSKGVFFLIMVLISLILVVFCLFVLPYGLILKLSGQSFWKILMPFRGFYDFYKLGGQSSLLIIGVIILFLANSILPTILPVYKEFSLITNLIGMIGHVYLCIKVSDRFRKTRLMGAGIAFLPFIFCLVFYFSKSSGQTSTQNNYVPELRKAG